MTASGPKLFSRNALTSNTRGPLCPSKMIIFQYMLPACLFVLPISARGQPKAKAQNNSNSGNGGSGGGNGSNNGNSNNGGSDNKGSGNGGSWGGGGSEGNGGNGGNGGSGGSGGSGGGGNGSSGGGNGGSSGGNGSNGNGSNGSNGNNDKGKSETKAEPQQQQEQPPPGPSGNKGPKKGVNPPGALSTTSTTSTETSTSTFTSTSTSTEIPTSASDAPSSSTQAPSIVPQPVATTSPTETPSVTSSDVLLTTSTTSTTSGVPSLLSSVSTEPVSSSTSGSSASKPSTSSSVATPITPALEYSTATELDLPAIPTTVTITPSERSTNHRTLVITLSVVFGILGFALILAAFYFLYLYRTGRRPFGHRGATPINDDEIATWRRSGTSTIRENTAIEPAIEKDPVPMMPEVALGHLTHNSGWNWSMPSSPTSTTRPGFTSGLTLPDTPSFLARAPNARAGLTDETVPGEDPFIQPVKRQSSRLSKAPPGHGRSKSRRSSISGKSIMSVRSGPVPPLSAGPRTPQSNAPTWYDPDDEARWRRIRDHEYQTSSTIINHVPGGLSPRPVSSIRPGTGRTIA